MSLIELLVMPLGQFDERYEMTQKLAEIYHYEQMADWLATSGQPTREQFGDISAAGYSAVVNLALNDADTAIPEEGRIVTDLGMSYFQIPVRFDAPQLADLQLYFGALDALKGRNVWVHCVVNARVSAFTYHYLTVREGVAPTLAKSSLLKRWEPDMDEIWKEFLAIPASKLG